MTRVAVSEGTRLGLFGIVKEAALTALVALILAIPMVGLRTVSAPGGLGVETRWWWVAVGVGIVFFGRIVLILVREWRRRRSATQGSASDWAIGGISRYFGLLAAVFAIVLPFMPFVDRWILDIGILVLTYI
ncbi:MAG: DUF3382 domain-containing protein, partial [Candidatus Binatia bacterium]